jgi:hypothetical protein
MQDEAAQEKYVYRAGTWVGYPDQLQASERLFPT